MAGVHDYTSWHGEAQERSHAFDPHSRPEVFSGVLSRRFCAFLIDATVIATMTLFGWAVLVVLGIFTFGLFWLLLGAVFPLTALTYTGLSLGGPNSATPGMNMMGLEMRTWDGASMTFINGIAHVVLFWVSFALLTPLIAVFALFNDRHRMLHDYVIGSVVVRTGQRFANAHTE